MSKRELNEPDKATEISHLRNALVFHFDGHGKSDPINPSKSCILLHYWKSNPLKVEDLMDLKLYEQAPSFFLS